MVKDVPFHFHFFFVAAIEIYAQRPQLGRGYTALMGAADNGHVEMVQLLLDAGANKAQGWMEPSQQKAANILDKGRHENQGWFYSSNCVIFLNKRKLCV